MLLNDTMQRVRRDAGHIAPSDGQNLVSVDLLGALVARFFWVFVYTQTILSSGQLTGHPRFKASHLFLFCWSSVSINFLVLLW